MTTLSDLTTEDLMLELVQAQDRVEVAMQEIQDLAQDAIQEVGLLIAAVGFRLRGEALPPVLEQRLAENLRRVRT